MHTGGVISRPPCHRSPLWAIGAASVVGPKAPIVRSHDGWHVRALALLATMLALLAGVGALGCGRSDPSRPDGPMRIVVSIAPLAGLVREIAPDAEVTILVPAGVSEHGYELTPSDVDRLRHADLIVGVGLGLEPRLEEMVRRLGDGADVLWFAECLTPEELATGGAAEPGHEGHDHVANEHDHHDAHDHSAGDPHLWLDPVLVEKFVWALGTRVGEVGGRIVPQGRVAGPGAGELVEARRTEARLAAEALAARVRAVDSHARDAMAPLQGRAIVTHHASHGRFAARYGLRIAATIRLSETSEPTPGQVDASIRAIRERNVPAVFVEPQFDSSTAARIAQEAGVRVVTLDPMGDGDWFALMDHTITIIADALGDDTTPTTTPALPAQSPAPSATPPSAPSGGAP